MRGEGKVRRLRRGVAVAACLLGLTWGLLALADAQARRVLVWRIEPAHGAEALEASAALCTRLSLNTASAQELAALPGIGPVLAERILAYRQAWGSYVDAAELVRILGIGTATYEALEALVCACTPNPSLPGINPIP